MKKNIPKAEEGFERSFEFRIFIQLLGEKYPSLTPQKISDTVDKCLKQISSPALRDELIGCLMQRLGLKKEEGENSKESFTSDNSGSEDIK